MIKKLTKKIKETKMDHKGKIPVLITTDSTKRGVFSGFINPEDSEKEILSVEELRMCVYWSTDMKGVLGLASMGPSKSCKISKAVKKATLSGVTAVLELSEEALEKWRSEPWGQIAQYGYFIKQCETLFKEMNHK